jgi:serine/threonine protein phosphatase PrpC
MLCKGVPLVDQTDCGEIFVVADGVSDAIRGMNAAQEVCDCVVNFYTAPFFLERNNARLHDLLVAANVEIAGWGLDENGRAQGAAAASVALLYGDQLTVFQVGDTLPLLMRDGSWWKLSDEVSPIRGLQRYFGLHGLVLSSRTWTVHDGDRILLATDGLTRVAQTPHIADIVTDASSPREAAQALADFAARTTPDDVTVLVIEIDLGA